MVNRHRRESYDYDYDRESEHSYQSFRPRSPLQSEWRDNIRVGPATKTWVNPNLQAKPSTSWKDNATNRYNESRSFREDSRSLHSDKRSRSPQFKLLPSPPFPPPKKLLNQLNNHTSPDPRPLPSPSRSDLSVHAYEKGSSPGFNIRGQINPLLKTLYLDYPDTLIRILVLTFIWVG